MSFYLVVWCMVCVLRLGLCDINCKTYLTREACMTYASTDCGWSQENGQCISKSQSTYFRRIKEYDPKLAFNLTLMSAIAYSADPKRCQAKGFPDSDFVLHQSVESQCEDLPLFEYKQCFAYTAVSKASKTILVAFRGTIVGRNPSQLIDQMISVLIQPKESFIIGGEVQRYFKAAHDKMNPCIEKSFKNLTASYPDYDVIFTGHSLGAALASLSAASLVHKGLVNGDKTSTYLFGEPRVGNGEYAKNYDKLIQRNWRIVHNIDVVAHLPTCYLFSGCLPTEGPYHTKTEVFYPDVSMNVSSKYKICEKNEDFSCSDGLIKTDWCLRSGIAHCIECHLNYFGIHLGTYCAKLASHRDSFESHWSRYSFQTRGKGREVLGNGDNSCSITNL